MMSSAFNLRTASGPRAILETLIGAALFTAGLFNLREQMAPAIVGQGLIMLTAVSAAWCALRWRMPKQGIIGRHLAVVLTLSATMYLGIAVTATPLGWFQILETSTFRVRGLTWFLIGTGPLFVGFRALFQLAIFWNRLRRRRLRWAVAHSQLMLILILFAIWGGYVSWLAFRSRIGFEDPSLAATLMDRLIVTLFPAVSVATIASLIMVVVLSPLLAILSYWTSRPITARLERLARSTAALADGKLDERIEVEGEDEVAGLQRDFNVMASSLDSAQQALSDEKDRVAQLLDDRRALMAKISHELRTPVTVLAAHLETAADVGKADAPVLELLRGEVERLDLLIDDLFTLARAETRSLEIDLDRVELAPLIAARIEALAPLAWRTRKVELVAVPLDSLPSVLADARRIEQILVNLIRNGIDHTPPGGLVSVSAQAVAGGVELCVADTGEGIDEADLPRIWDRFWRGEDASRRRRGAGLGLPLVKELTEAMGGQVSAQSKRNEGSRFIITLPIAPTAP